MALETTSGLALPELPTKEVDNYKALTFVRSIFRLNGCLDDIPNCEEYFYFGRGDREAKKDVVSRFLRISASARPLVFETTFQRISQADSQRQEDSQRSYDSYMTVGTETYRIGEVATSSLLVRANPLIRATYPHQIGSGPAGGGLGHGPYIDGPLWADAHEEVRGKSEFIGAAQEQEDKHDHAG